MVPATVRKLWSWRDEPDRAVCPPELLPIAGATAARGLQTSCGMAEWSLWRHEDRAWSPLGLRQ